VDAVESIPAEDLPVRERLLREAAAILVSSGMPGLTVRRVAEAARCSTIGVYTHFGGKPGLVEALLLDAYTDFEAALSTVDRLPPGRARLDAEGHAYRDWALANPNRYLVMFTAYPEFTPSDEAVERMARSLVAHTRRVAEAADVGDVAADDVDGMAYQLWAFVHGYVLLDLFTGRGPDDEAARTAFGAAAARTLDGLAPR
jgi:AcrR family transcriptional regulator